MKIEEFKKRIENIKYNNLIIINPSDEKMVSKSDVFVIKKLYNNWIVYYSERGRMFSVKYFREEENACQYLYDKFLSTFKDK